MTRLPPNEWHGRYLEDFEVGGRLRAASAARSPRRTTSGSRALTLNTNHVPFDAEFAAATRFGGPL